MSLAFATLFALVQPALAQDDPGPDPLLPIPTLRYDRPPPDFSYEIGVQVSYGVIARWTPEIAPWVGFGLRGGWGRNIPDSYQHRVGVSMLLFVEGPLPIHLSSGLEPHLTWDWVGKKGLLLGAGAGGAVMYHSKIESGSNVTREAGVGASAAARIGWSQTWSRVGRRMFVYVEPKYRYLGVNHHGPMVQVVIGSGKGY